MKQKEEDDLDALIAKIPFPFDRSSIETIKIIPPDIFFEKIHDYLYKYYITNKIFKFPEGE